MKRGYSLETFQKDAMAGIIVGVISIPLGMAFAIASGVSPEYGLYATIIAGIIVSLLGGSTFQIAGPTGAFIPILLAIVLQYGYEQLLIAGFMAGAIMLLLGICKLGNLITYIPRPVTIGFTAGIAVIIFTGQVSNFLGLSDVEKHESFLLNMKEIYLHLDTLNIYSVLIGLICLFTSLFAGKVVRKIPSVLVGIVVSTLVAVFLLDDKVATVGTVYGTIPNGFPQLQMPDVSLSVLISLLGPALVIASLGSIESLLSCVVADGMTGERHDSNKELRAQGIANMVTPLFGGIPATGAIARTATNIKSGAVTKMSGMIHSVFVLLVLLLFAQYASLIPLASLAPVLMIVAWNMSERKEFAHVLKTTGSDSIVLLVTFLLTVFTDLTLAVSVGLLLAMLLFVKRVSQMLDVSKVLPDHGTLERKVKSDVVTKHHDCPQVSIFTIQGPLFFGSAQLFEKKIIPTLKMTPTILILRMGKVPLLDATGMNQIESIVSTFSKQGRLVLLTNVQAQPKDVLERSGLAQQIGESHFFLHTGDAITYALRHIQQQKCLGCKHFAFKECAQLSASQQTS
ncbi:SulP family inorganic anion transporter [Halalkalibacter oceani]|uniref:SulP family inorganic anion transporter n=1 Tax=Halalkalibacter oceani TaxID=1653776 RepID=UPI003391F3F6